MKFLPAFAVFGADVLAKALDTNADDNDLRVGQVVGSESNTTIKLWDTAQILWDAEHPRRLCDTPFWPIYGAAGWELTAFDPIAVNREIAYAVRL